MNYLLNLGSVVTKIGGLANRFSVSIILEAVKCIAEE